MQSSANIKFQQAKASHSVSVCPLAWGKVGHLSLQCLSEMKSAAIKTRLGTAAFHTLLVVLSTLSI